MTTSFERILWAIAGAERHILEKCRTDYKRFSAIGATILMTSFIAFCAGTAAAWFFTQKIAEFAIILELNGYSGCMEIG